MNTILKRVISLLLCFVMIAGYMPVNAFATENGETVTTETTEVTAEQTEAASEETEAPSESTESLAELSEVTDDSDEEEEETEKESEKEEKEAEKESKKEEKESEKESKKEEKPGKPGKPEEVTEPSTEATEPSSEATEPSTEATEPSTETTVPETTAPVTSFMMMRPAADEADVTEEVIEEEIFEVEALIAEVATDATPVPFELEGERTIPTKAQVKAALDEALAYTDALTIDNSSNDPATVVGNFGTHFTWDNEKREGSKDYLFDWSYYNGVVFEGLEYLYEVTDNAEYKNYVVEYMSALIASDGSWAKCTNNSAKTAAGYVDYHGADCYKTASLLLDASKMTGDDRYLTMAETLYADLDAAAETYLLPNAGNNYHHTWKSVSSPNLWLDGLYMILPFRAEYAKHINDTDELQAIVDRLTWVSNNMYNSTTGLFYHAANSASSNSGTYWLRSMGWYAAAIADVMDSVSASQRETLAAQLTKLADGLDAYRNEYGMWVNNLGAAASSSNPYETSGTALVCYALMKAVNNGWIDDSYAEMALTAMVGICDQKLSGNKLTDICFKGVPGGSNSTYYDNEGKGAGPFIMLTAEVQEYYDKVLSKPVMTGITVPANDVYYIGETLAPVVTASYDDGSTKTVTDYTVEGEYDMNTVGTYTVTVKVGEFTAEYTFSVVEATIPEDGTLTGLKVTTYPSLRHFVTEEALNITGMVVTATFTTEDDTVNVQIPWAETAADGKGYSVTYEPALTTVGEKTVTVKYTYGDVTLSDTFVVTVYEKTVSATTASGEEAPVVIEADVPGVSAVTVAESNETVKAAAAELAADAAYVAYDITLTADYAEAEEGLSFKVTMPLPEGEGVAQVWYIPTEEGKEPEQMTDVVDNGNGTVTFTTTHFSDYVSFYAAEEPVTGTGNLPGDTVVTYELDTDGLDNNAQYLIVSINTAGNGYALASTTTGVAVSVNADKLITEPGNAMVWTASGSNSSWTFRNSNSGTNNRYLGYSSDTNSSGWSTNYTYTLDPTASSMTWTVNGDTVKINLITTDGWREDTYNDYYLTLDRTCSMSTIPANVYFYKRVETTTPGGEVTFSVNPGAASLMAGASDTLTPTVTVGGANAANYTITWASADETKATVTQEGVVTAVGDTGDTPVNITATLSAVNGTELVADIVLTVPVTVSTKTVVSAVLNSNAGSIVRDHTGALEGATITVTYDDTTTAEVAVTTDMLSGNFNLKEDEVYPDLTVTYNGQVLSRNFTLTVKAVEGDDYPEYPNAGSVTVDKRADSTHLLESGVVQIELSTSGIPIKTGVNVLLVMDISNSMSWDDKAYDYNDTDIDFDSNQRLNASRDAAKSFAQTLLAPYADGTATKNTMTMLAFAGIDGNYNNYTNAMSYDDVYLMSDLAETNADAIADVLNDSSITRKAKTGGTNYDYAFQQAYDLANQLYALNGQQVYIVFMTDGAPTHYNGVYYKNRTTQDQTGLMQYVDPDSGNWSTYTSTGYDRNGNDIDVSNTYTSITFYPTNGDTPVVRNNIRYNKGWVDYITGNANEWNLKTKTNSHVAKIYSIGFGMANGSVTQGATSAMPTITNTGGGEFYIPASATETVLKNMASSASDYYAAENKEQLTELYRSLAAQIRQAATNAYFVDEMGDSFNLQMSQYVLKRQADGTLAYESLSSMGVPNPEIQIKNYKVFTAADVGQTLTYTENGNSVTKTVTADDVGKRYGDATVVETVTFTDELVTDDETGETTLKMTGAYSTAKDGNCLGTDGIIYGKYFFYNTNSTAKNITVTYDNGTADTTDDTTKTFSLPAESFYWNIGTINNLEWAMTYYEYLAGSMEGTASANSYATNKKATLYYKNWLGNNAFKDTTSPVVGWESANVHYAFYLVNEYGQPVVNQTTGQPGNFKNAVKVTQPVLWDEILLNNLENINTIKAASADIVPYGYELYDPAASYKIVILSDDGKGSWTIENTERADDKYVDLSTYVTGFKGDEYTNAPLVYGDEDTYTSGGFDDQGYVLQDGYGYTTTTVWFALVWVPKAIPDAVVIDYGLPVDISVMANDQFGTAGTSDGGKPIGATLNGIGTLDELDDVTYVQNSIHANASSFDEGDLQLDYGHAKMNGQEIRYTPDTMTWNSNAEGAKSYDKFAYEAEYYYYAEGFTAGEPDGDAESQYYYGEVTVIPATTVYYEDTYSNGVSNEYMTFKTISTETWQEIENAWTVVGSTVDATQAEDRPGQYSLPEIDANNVYGYDGAYANMSQFSLGSAHRITVNSSRNGVVEFSFYGTGFDLISLTDNTSGTIFADIIGETNGVEEFFLVDNYYGYVYGPVTEEDENGVPTTVNKWYPAESEDSNAIYQVPVMKVEGLPYGKYNVTLTAAYDKIFDHGQAQGAGAGIGGSYDLYVDAIRIYDPAGETAADLSDVVFEGETADKNVTIADIYEMDNEGWPQYVEVRNELINEATFKEAGGETYTGAIFIDGNAENKSVSDYTNFGPNNEVYLAEGQAVAFELDLSSYIAEMLDEKDDVIVDKETGKPLMKSIVADVQLGVKSATGEPVTVKLTTDTSTSGSGSVTTNASRSFNTSTDMYYSFSEMLDLGAEKDEAGNYVESNDSKTIVTIKNDGTDGIVSITNVKVTFSRQPAEVEPIMTWSLRGANRALMMMSAAPSVEIDPTEPDASEPDVVEPETTVPDETENETTVPEETEPEETEPEKDKDQEKLEKEIQKALEKAAKEAAKIAKELQKAAEKAAKEAAKALSKLFSGWF